MRYITYIANKSYKKKKTESNNLLEPFLNELINDLGEDDLSMNFLWII